MYSLILTAFAVLNCFFADFPQESESALTFFREHDEIRKELSHYLPDEEKDIAMAVVAPEVGMFSSLRNEVEYRTMCIFYILYGSADFSIGCFQMKPTFAETVEKEIAKRKEWKKKFPMLPIKGKTERERRKTRMDRLMQTTWQARYLAAFITIAKHNTSGISLSSVDDRVKYWATLYNSGLDLSEAQVYKMQRRRFFPRFRGRHNYGEAALDFYMHMKGIAH